MLTVLLILVFVRPFISSLTFSYANLIYSLGLLIFLFIWIFSKGISFEKLRPVQAPMLAFIIALIACAVFSYRISISIAELRKYLIYILAFLTTISLSNQDKNKLIKTIVFSGLIISVLAIFQYLFGFSYLAGYIHRKGITNPFVSDYISNKRIFLPFITPNILAGYLALIAPAAFTLKGKSKWPVLAAISSALLLTKSLGAFISLFVGAIFYICLKKGLSGKPLSRDIATAGKILLLAAIAISAVFIFFARQDSTKIHTLPGFSFAQRLSYWTDTLKIIMIRPLIGVGLGNFNLTQSRYAHNSYLQICAEAGLAGILSFLWFLIAIFKFGIINISRKKETIFLLTASLIFIIHNMVDFSFFLPEVCLIWWIIIGAAINSIPVDKIS